MRKSVLVLGGYGNFGRFIVSSLVKNKNLKIIIAGRSLEKAKELALHYSSHQAEFACIDININLSDTLRQIKPDIVIHTCGPFQGQDYLVASTCVKQGIHYIDLADARHFVSGISALNHLAEQKGVSAISGASSVPCLTSALLDKMNPDFSAMQFVEYAITTAQKTTRGLATTEAILSYTGKAFSTIKKGKIKKVYGWQGLKIRRYKGLGFRLLSLCNIPDLNLFPSRYPDLKTIKFYAGLELPFIHFTLWCLSWLVRFKAIKCLKPYASKLLNISFLFDKLGSDRSGFHMTIKGRDKAGHKKIRTFELRAFDGDGPFIPCIPAILLAQKIASCDWKHSGATPCIGLITIEEYLSALREFNIEWEYT